MDELKRSIEEARASNRAISRACVRGWIERSAAVEVDALLYKLTREAWSRIEPELERDETCAFIERYLLACIRQDPHDDEALSRYEAAYELEVWFDHGARTAGGGDVLPRLVSAVTSLFLTSGREVQTAIETGFLEHVLEQPAMRPLFAHWAQDERLQDAWRHALAWGEAHPHFMSNLRATFPGPSDED
jgi:hypothetical protein